MGLLDDAIREHLDLKRRRGADPTEVERLEREALGPVRRGARDVHGLPPEAEEPGVAYHDEAPGEEWSEPLDQPAFHGARSEPIDDDDDVEEWEVPAREPLGGVGVEPEAAPATPVPPPSQEDATAPPQPLREEDLLDQETVEHDVEAEHAAEQARESEEEDMLEETPEFLQDTPDHDRLWFEQRPPRDFDLDG